MKVIFHDYTLKNITDLELSELFESRSVNILTDKIFNTYNSQAVDVYYITKSKQIKMLLCHDTELLSEEQAKLFSRDVNNNLILNRRKLKRKIKCFVKFYPKA